jgi:hypothetical protein
MMYSFLIDLNCLDGKDAGTMNDMRRYTNFFMISFLSEVTNKQLKEQKGHNHFDQNRDKEEAWCVDEAYDINKDLCGDQH